MEDILAGVRKGGHGGDAAAGAGDIQIQIEPKENFMADFFARVTNIKEELVNVRGDLDRFQKLKDMIANAPETERMCHYVGCNDSAHLLYV